MEPRSALVRTGAGGRRRPREGNVALGPSARKRLGLCPLLDFEFGSTPGILGLPYLKSGMMARLCSGDFLFGLVYTTARSQSAHKSGFLTYPFFCVACAVGNAQNQPKTVPAQHRQITACCASRIPSWAEPFRGGAGDQASAWPCTLETKS